MSTQEKKIDKAKKFYNNFAKNYDNARYISKQQKSKDIVAKKIYLEFAGEIKGKKHLDCGCGTGRMLELFSSKGANVTGVDTSEEMLKISNKKVPKAKLIQGSIFKIPIDNESFDIITCSQVLTHLNEYIRPLKEFKRLLKDDGVIIIDIRNRYNIMNFLSSIVQWLKNSDYRPHYTTVCNIRRICKKLGLKVTDVIGNDTKIHRGFAKQFKINLTIRITK